ncbi:MAG: hypothetical protein ACREUG_03860 [Steroidobacteraceae bacterium]
MRLAGTVVAAGLLYAASPAPGLAAVNWNYDPRVEVGGTYDDNYLLGETAPFQTSVAGPFVDAEVALHGTSPRNDFVLTPQVHSTLYPGHAEDQSTDGYLSLNDTYDTLRTRTVLKGAYADQTIVAADFLPATFAGVPLGQPVISNSGEVAQIERQQTVSLDPSTSLRWSERGHLDLGADYYRAWFSANVPGQLPFQSATGSVGVGYEVSQRSDLSVRGSYTAFEPEGITPSARHGGIDGQWDYIESTILHLYLRAGAGLTEGRPNTASNEVTLTDFEGGIGAHWHYPVTDVYVDLLRTAEPSSFGVLVNQDEARLRVVRRFTQMVAGFVAVRGIRTVEALSGVSSVPNREYATGAAGFEWRIAESYSLEASYTYTWQKYQNDPLHAASNGVGLSIVYEPHRLSRPPEPGPVGGGIY